LVQLIQAGHDQLSGRLSDLLGDMQILDAKLHDLAQQDDDFSSLRIHTARGYLIDVAIVSERVSAFFEYGRRRSELVPRPPTWAAVTGALNLLGFDKDQNPDLYAIINGRDAGKIPVGPMERMGAAFPASKHWRFNLWRWTLHIEARAQPASQSTT
jgi:hypothetical protein